MTVIIKKYFIKRNMKTNEKRFEFRSKLLDILFAMDSPVEKFVQVLEHCVSKDVGQYNGGQGEPLSFDRSRNHL